jgi:Glycosyltransferase
MAHLVHIISSLERGGAQAVLYNLVRNLSHHRHTIIFFHDGPYHQMFHDQSISVYQITAPGGFHSPLFTWRLYNLVKKLHPDCIHTVLWAANLLGRIVARWLAIPVVASLHNKAALNGNMRLLLDKLIMIKPARVIAVSQDVADSFIQKKLVAPDKVTVIINGVALGDAVGDGEIFGITADDFVIGSVGRFSPEKRFDLLLAAFAQVVIVEPNVRLVICGAGHGYHALKQLAESLKIDRKVYFVINKDVAAYYYRFNLFVMTSQSEGVSIALLQAMAAGCASVIMHDFGPHPVVTSGYDGFVVYGQNATDIAGQIISLIRAHEERNALGQNAQQTIKDRFSINRMIAAYDDIFSEYSTRI